jgi:ABC-type transport system involved in Fe-S cluster assembly fused permease/ATPase subunit
VVLQDVLFADTIYNNITLNNPAITQGDVLRSQRNWSTRLHYELPDNYDFDVKNAVLCCPHRRRRLIAFCRVPM